LSLRCEFRPEKSKDFYFEFLRFALSVVLKLVHVLLELLDLRLGRCPRLLHGLDGGFLLYDGPLELCYFRADLKQGGWPSSAKNPKENEIRNDAPAYHCCFQLAHATSAVHTL
jgi:hypothetical protein